MKTFIGKMVLRNNVFQPATKRDLEMYNLFKSQLKEGEYIDLYMEVNDPNGTLAQIAKLHAMIRELSSFTGESFDDMKLFVKQKAGLVIQETSSIHIKSFRDCTKQELSTAIQSAINIGDNISCPVR